MKSLTIAALCAGLVAVPLVGRAAELVLFDGVGQPVAVLVPTGAPLDMPGFPAGLLARQDAMMDRMMQTMQAAFDDAPSGLATAAFGPMQPGSTIVTTSFSDGHTSCSRTISYEQRGNAAPLMKVSQTGDACDMLASPGRPSTVPAALPERAPAPEMVAPAQIRPNGLDLIRVSYHHPARKPVLHRG